MCYVSLTVLEVSVLDRDRRHTGSCSVDYKNYTLTELPGEPKKNPPLRLLLLLQQCMGIFVQNFTRLLSDQIYTLSPSFIEIFLELTKLHSFNHDNPHFTR